MEELVKRRVDRLKKLLESHKNPFSEVTFSRSNNFSEIIEKFSKLKEGESSGKKASLAGRLTSIRIHGGVAFANIQDENASLQLMFRKDKSGEAFTFLSDFLDEGDIVGVKGEVIKTRKGQLSLLVSELTLLSKSLRPLPSEWYGLKNTETRYRQRYLDLIMNPDVRANFAKISHMINGMRSHLVKSGFLEVFTPILQPIYGGAFAKPFKTHHNFLKQEMYLRIAPELYLKKLIVGGYDKVFEVASCFRNESVDSTHNPEFIQIEAYQAYANYEDMMRLVENMVSAGVKAALGTTKIEFQGKKIDLAPPWERKTIESAIKEHGLDISKLSDKDILKKAKEMEINAPRVGDAIEGIFEELVQPNIVAPTFITDFPSDISPLAKKFPNNPKMAQRFEAYIAGMEVSNAFSELNNPVEQYNRFKADEELRKRVRDAEYMPMDKDYIRALEYGMPPTGGLGVGLARIASIMLDKPSIKEVILFPFVGGIEKIKTVAEMDKDLKEYFK